MTGTGRGTEGAQPKRERIILNAEGAVVGTRTVRFDGLVLPIADVIALRIETDSRSGTFGLIVGANVFIGTATLFWLPIVAGAWTWKFLIAVALLGGVGATFMQDALAVPDRHLAKLVVTTAEGDRVVFVSKSVAFVERIADAILSAKAVGEERAPLPPARRDVRSVGRAFAAMRRPLARSGRECEAGEDPAIATGKAA